MAFASPNILSYVNWSFLGSKRTYTFSQILLSRTLPVALYLTHTLVIDFHCYLHGRKENDRSIQPQIE